MLFIVFFDINAKEDYRIKYIIINLFKNIRIYLEEDRGAIRFPVWVARITFSEHLVNSTLKFYIFSMFFRLVSVTVWMGACVGCWVRGFESM